jgi:hypothetical protein
MGKKSQHVPPAIVVLSTKDGLKDVTFLSGRRRTAINDIDGGRSAKLEWLIQAAPTVTGLDVSLESANAGSDASRINLGALQGGVR